MSYERRRESAEGTPVERRTRSSRATRPVEFRSLSNPGTPSGADGRPPHSTPSPRFLVVGPGAGSRTEPRVFRRRAGQAVQLSQSADARFRRGADHFRSGAERHHDMGADVPPSQRDCCGHCGGGCDVLVRQSSSDSEATSAGGCWRVAPAKQCLQMEQGSQPSSNPALRQTVAGRSFPGRAL